MRVIRFLVLLLCCFFTGNSYGESVIWLKTITPHIARGIERVNNELISYSGLFNKDLDDEYNANLKSYEVTYDKESFKTYINLEVVSKKSDNNKKLCRFAIKYTKDKVFTDQPHWKIEEFFPQMDKNDLRYFLKIKTLVHTYGVKDSITRKIKEITNYNTVLPKNAEVIKETYCISNLLSEEVFFE